MRTIIRKSLLVSSILLLTCQGSNAESIPNFNMPAPLWNGQAPIAWGDCIPVPVVTVPLNNINMGAMPPQPMMMPQPYPPMAEQPIIMPPPSPFFNTIPSPAPLPSVVEKVSPHVACNDKNEQALKSLQARYSQGASASKSKIEELNQALDDAHNQLADARIIIESFSKEQEANNENSIKIKQQLIKLENTNKTLQAKLSTSDSRTGSQARKITALNQSAAELVALRSVYKARNDENTALKKQLLDLDNAHKSLKTKLGSAKASAGSQARKLTALSQSATELTALRSAYKTKNNDNALLKKKLADSEKEKSGLNSKLESLHTASTLKSAQDKNTIDTLRKKLTTLDNTHKSLKTKLGAIEANAGSQARKLTALGQSATELTALQSAYKAKNNENSSLKLKLASLNKKLTSLNTASTLKETHDANTIIALKKKLAELDSAHKSLKTKLGAVEANAGSQARKLTALGQSATELTALQSAYKAKNSENTALKEQLAKLNETANICKFEVAELKKNLAGSDDKKKTLLAKMNTLKQVSSDQARKITALMATSLELEGLKSAYKDLSSKKVELSSKLSAATADTDKDGVLDSSDKCPYSLEGVEVNALGCLADVDNDGVTDSKDNCPASPIGSHVDEKGCPRIKDTDADGVADANDLCPATSAGTTVNQFGCEPTENINLKGVNFATGSAHLTTSSFPILAAAANTLKKNPNLKIEISGYTDNQGLGYFNKRLSQRRANAVMIQLIKDGVDANTLVAKGYGEKNPIASNTTEEGRATNRRVELKIRQ